MFFKSRARSSNNSGASSSPANSLTQRRTRARSSRGCVASTPSMSPRSRGRWAIAFMTMRSSGETIGIEIPARRCLRARAILSSSNGRAPTLTSRSIELGSCRSTSTRARRAKARASGRRGRIPNRSPLSRNASHRSSSSHMSASTSPVTRGRPRIDAATPPISAPGTLSAAIHATMSRIAAASGTSGDLRSTTERLPKPSPSAADDGIFRREALSISNSVTRFHERGNNAEPAGGCRAAQLVVRCARDQAPARAKRPSIGNSHRHRDLERYAASGTRATSSAASAEGGFAYREAVDAGHPSRSACSRWPPRA